MLPLEPEMQWQWEQLLPSDMNLKKQTQTPSLLLPLLLLQRENYYRYRP